MSVTGLLARTTDEARPSRDGARHRHDVLRALVPTTARGEIGAVTSRGRLVRLPVLDLPSLPPTDGAPSLSGGVPVGEVVTLEAGETVVGLASLEPEAPSLALGTAGGVVKRVTPGDVPANKDTWEVIALKDGDEVVSAGTATDDDELVLISSDASLLHFPAAFVRPQGRAAGGMAGIKLADGQRVVFFGVCPPAGAAGASPDDDAADGADGGDGDGSGPGSGLAVVTIAGSSSALPGTEVGTAKTTPFDLYPGKGRATGGVRAHRFLKGEDTLVLAWVGPTPPRATGSAGQPIDLPPVDTRRDGSGVVLPAPVHGIG
jgi:DNA gyrase subunit A